MIKTKKYTLSKQNFRKFTRKEFLKNSKVFIALTILALIGISSISIYGFMILGNNKILEAWEPFLVLVIIFWFIMLFYVPYRLSNLKINRLMFNEWQCSFNEESFITESDQGHKISAKFSTLPKISIDSEYFMLYLTSTFVLLVVKEAFQNESDFIKVTKIISKN